MKMKILALMLSVALTGAAEARNDSKFRASAETVAEVQNNGALPPAAACLEIRRHACRLEAHVQNHVRPAHNGRRAAWPGRFISKPARNRHLDSLAVATVILNRVKASRQYPLPSAAWSTKVPIA